MAKGEGMKGLYEIKGRAFAPGMAHGLALDNNQFVLLNAGLAAGKPVTAERLKRKPNP